MNNTYDVAIIGGGIAGAGIARDAALRGLRVVLFEKNTFGSGASSKSSRLIHGGIRYLETAWTELKKGRAAEAWKNLRFVWNSLRESKILRKTAPTLVQPLPLLIPILKHDKRRLWEVCLGSWLYFFLSSLSGPAVPPKILWNGREVQKIIPALDAKKTKAGVIIRDHWTDDQALVKQILLSASRHGAALFENAEVTNYSFDADTRLYKIRVRQNGTERDYAAEKLINAGGPWVDKIRAIGNEKTEDFIVPIAGAHIVLKKFIPHSVILEASDGRLFFVINAGDFSRVGTTERLCDDPDSVAPTEGDLDYLLTALKKYFPALGLDRTKIVGQDAGVRPLARPKQEKSAHSILRDHEIRTGPTGVIHVLGVKLTDHRRAAEAVVNRLTKKRCLTRTTPL